MKKPSKLLLAGIALLALAALGLLLLLAITICGLGGLVLLSLPASTSSTDSGASPTFEAYPAPSTSSVSSTPTPAAYPPQLPYYDKNVLLDVKQTDSGTLYVKNSGGTDAPSLKRIWVNADRRGYVEPTSGQVTSQKGSAAYYNISSDSFVTITGEFTACNAILWSGNPSAPTAAPTVRPVPAPSKKAISVASSEPEYYERTYQWTFKKHQYTWDLSISKAIYDYYRGQPHDRESDYAMYAMSDYDRVYLQSLASKLQEAAARDGYSEQEAVLLTIAFVQSLPYTYDNVSTGYDEYPRYPLETLVDNGGDCEDTAILTAALLNEMDYGVVLLRLPGHMAVGVKGTDDYPGTYWEYKGSKYYYLETTGENWKIGQVPPEYQNARATLYPLQQIPRIDLSFNSTYVDSDAYSVYYLVHCDYANIGTGTAKNVSLYFAALAPGQGEDLIWSPDHTANVGDCPEGGSGWAEATLRIPRNEQSQIECVAYGDNFKSASAKTETFDT